MQTYLPAFLLQKSLMQIEFCTQPQLSKKLKKIFKRKDEADSITVCKMSTTLLLFGGMITEL